MSDAKDAFGFGRFVPGFDFLQNLATSAVKGASQSIPQLPNLANWVAPTLNVEELDKRIDELKAVQFWLDQNATALKATIQALEVQKMTLATLKGMNFNMGDVANAFKLKTADALATSSLPAFGVPVAAPAQPVALAPAARKAPRKKPARRPSAKTAAPAQVLDPLQWWGSLTEQFQQIAATAMKDVARQSAMDTARNVGAAVAKEAVRGAAGAARSAVSTATGVAAAGASVARSAAARALTPAKTAAEPSAVRKTARPAGTRTRARR